MWGLKPVTWIAESAGCSFAVGTPVLMADGHFQAVESIQAGDRMLAKDEASGTLQAQEVTATVHHPAATLATVMLTGAHGTVQRLVCTPEHPFFVDGKGWVEAGSLGIGTSIASRAGPSLSVTHLDWQRSAEAKPAFTVYNFTVDEAHTFFVGSAEGGAWTHNAGCWITKNTYQEVRKQSEQLLGRFLRAAEKGSVGSQNEAGIKQLNPPVGDYTHELKINGSGARIFGKLGSWRGKPTYIFDRFSNKGLH